MLRTILIYGVIGGLIVAVPWLTFMPALSGMIPPEYGMLIGYAVMLVALTTVFLAIKDYRDKKLGGVIKFLPALAIGLGITVIAGLFYAGSWEIHVAFTGTGETDSYFAHAIADARKTGTPEEITKAVAGIEQMRDSYNSSIVNRMATTFFQEFAPVGVIISLISAALLRNSRFMPARKPG